MPGAGERARLCSGRWESRGAGGTEGRGDLSKGKMVETVFPSATHLSRVCWHQVPAQAILVLRSHFGAKSAIGVGERFARCTGVRASDAFPVPSPWDGLQETQTEGSGTARGQDSLHCAGAGACGQLAWESLRPLSSGADFGTGLPPRAGMSQSRGRWQHSAQQRGGVQGFLNVQCTALLPAGRTTSRGGRSGRCSAAV